MSAMVRDAAVVLLLSSIVFLGDLGGCKLWDEDEPRNAQCAAEMLERGDLVVPTFNGELRTHKPVLLYWAMMASYRTFGVNEFAARLPSALSGIATVFLVWLCGRRMFGPRASLFASIALSTSLMFDVAARAATPDSVLIVWVTAAITIYIHAVFHRDDQNSEDSIPSLQKWFPQSRLSLCGFFGCLGMAMLAKGPVGFVLPMAIIGMFLLIMRRADSEVRVSKPGGDSRRTASRWDSLKLAASWFAPLHFAKTLWCMRPISGTIISLAVAFPWYYSVGVATNGQWLRGFFLEHNLGRATEAMENHSGPFLLYYIVAVMIGFFPWSVLVLPSVLDARKRYLAELRIHPGIVLSLCWIAVPIFLFSCATTKLPSYISPGYPGVALLVGTCIQRLSAGHSQLRIGWMRAALGSSVIVGVGITVGGILAISELFPGESLLLAPGIVLAVTSLLGLLTIRPGRLDRPIWTYASGAVAFAICIFQFAAPRASAYQQFDGLVSAAKDKGADIGTFEVMRSSWVYYAGQTLERFNRNEPEKVREFLESGPSQFLITEAGRMGEMSTRLGIPLMQVGAVPWFLNGDERLVLVTRAPHVANQADDADGLPPRIAGEEFKTVRSMRSRLRTRPR